MNEQKVPAVAGRVEQPVRPRAWLLEGTQAVEFDEQRYHVGSEWTALYDQAALDAAVEQANARQNAAWRLMCEKMVAAEQKRCANVVRYWLAGYPPEPGSYAERCVNHILDGRPAPEGPNTEAQRAAAGGPTGAQSYALMGEKGTTWDKQKHAGHLNSARPKPSCETRRRSESASESGLNMRPNLN